MAMVVIRLLFPLSFIESPNTKYHGTTGAPSSPFRNDNVKRTKIITGILNSRTGERKKKMAIKEQNTKAGKRGTEENKG